MFITTFDGHLVAKTFFISSFHQNFPGSVKGGRPAHKADNLNAICEPIV
jgi:hypothetical protein